jgi:kynureninase
MAPVLASLEMFDEVGMDGLRAKSVRLTGYLESLLDSVWSSTGTGPIETITPRDPARRGTQLSVRIHGLDAGTVSERLRHEHGVFADARQPDVVRLAPAPMYCTFHDCWRAATALAEVMGGHG